MNEKYDVIIVGAGPAGLACARQLADTDLSVLIIDKNKDTSHKLCAGGVRVSDLGELGLIANEVKGCEILTSEDNGQIVDFTTIDRKLLAQGQLKLIENAKNMVQLLGWRVTDILPGKIILDSKTETKSIFFNYLVGADGSFSKVRQKLGITNRLDLILKCSQLDIPLNNILHEFKTLTYFYNKALFGNWYGYVFPHFGSGLAKVGYGGSIEWLQNQGIEFKSNLENWLKNLGINMQDVVIESAFINTDYQGFNFNQSQLGKVFLCGDAAGFASYYSGEGIHQALVSGSETGKIILNNNYNSVPLNEIIKIKENEINGIFSNSQPGIWDGIKQIFFRLINSVR